MTDEGKPREELLEEIAELRYEARLLGQLGAAINIVGPHDGTILHTNAQFEAMLGYEPGELAGNHISVVNAPGEKTPAETADDIMQCLNDAGHWSGEIRNIRKDGSTFWCHVTVVGADHPKHGKVWASVHEDVTDRKRAEEGLRRERDFVESLIDTAQAIVLVLDAEGRVVRFNRYMEEVSGYSLEEVRGRDWISTFLPERDRERIRRLFVSAIADIRTAGNVNPIVTREGREREIEWYDRALRNADGDVVGLLAIGQDVTDRVRAEEGLRESQTMLRLVLDTIPAFVFWKDRDSVYLGCNRNFSHAIGLGEPENVVGKTDYDIFPDKELADSYRGWDRRVMEADAPALHVVEKWHGAGSTEERWAETNKVPVHDGDGNVVGVLGTYEDISERKRAEEQRALALGVLKLLNKSSERRDCIREILLLVKDATGFDAVGIRLAEGDDFPYYETNGFPAEFVEAENYLCEYDGNDKPVRDATGNPCLDCMCGNVIRGRTDASKPFFTEGGSFWTNSTTELLASTTEQDRLARTRNRCSGEGYESVALVPLRAGADTIGLLQLNDRRKDMLTPGQIVFLEGLGASIGVALARREAGEKLRAHEERLRSLASEFSLAEERERRRIAVGLHDNITQDLIAMKTRFDSCSRHKTIAACDECVHKTQELVQNSISELRALTFELASPILYELGLVAALDEMVGEFQEKHGIRSEFEDDGKAKPLGPDLGALVFRAVRELLVNVVKHAEADRVTVSTIRDDQGLKVVVEDDGIGFDTAEAARAAARSGAFGLFGVRERLEYLGGGMRLESEPGRGARVILVVPLKDEPPFAPSELRRAPSSIALAKEDERDADAEGGR